jgi:hypothetical protein
MTIYLISIVEYEKIDMIISTDEISIVAGWAPGHEGVKVSPPFLLHPEASTSHLIKRKKSVRNFIMDGKIETDKERGEGSIVKGICIYIYICLCMYVYIYTYMYIYVYIYTYVYIKEIN